MAKTTVNMHAAKTQLCQLVARAERGERIMIARDGKPVAELGPVPKSRREPVSPDDPLLSLDQFAVDGSGGELHNEDIDRLVYGNE